MKRAWFMIVAIGVQARPGPGAAAIKQPAAIWGQGD